VQEKLQQMEKGSHAGNELSDFEGLERLLERCVATRQQDQGSQRAC